MKPGSGQADKNGLCLWSTASVVCLRGWRPSGRTLLSEVIGMDWRVDRELLEKHQLPIYNILLMKFHLYTAITILQKIFATQVHSYFVIRL